MSAARVIQAVRPHIPLIKFRSGGLQRTVFPPVLTAITPTPSSNSATKPPSTRISNAPEFFQLAAKYRRAELTQEEIDFINRGGPD